MSAACQGALTDGWLNTNHPQCCCRPNACATALSQYYTDPGIFDAAHSACRFGGSAGEEFATDSPAALHLMWGAHASYPILLLQRFCVQ